MRTDPMEQKLKTAAEHLTPDVLDRILADCAKDPKGEILYMETMSDPRSRNNNWIKALSLGTAACMMVGGLFWWNRYRALNYTVEMDVNPSIELRINNAEKVIAAEALNEDAEIILEDMKLRGVDVDVATNALIGSMVKNGYLSELSNSILLTVESDDTQKAAAVSDRLTQEINTALDRFGGSVIAQQVVLDNDLQMLAGSYNISEGKAALIRNIRNELPMLKAEDLAKMSINDLNLLASSKQISLSNTTTTGTASESGYIGAARAEEIALKHAGLQADTADSIQTELDCDNGEMEYEVDFRAGGVEYEYAIHARSGKILRYEYEVTSNENSPEEGYITAQQARQAALVDAGLAEGEVTFIKTRMDQDDGTMLYEIEFCTDSKTYEYEIDARTGAVLTADSETGSLPTDPDQRITAAQAREKVLEHLGMEAGEVTFKKVELDHDDNRMRYEIVLVAGSREYEYELDAQDGAVLSWDYEELENDDLKNYKAKAEFYVRQHQDKPAIAKLRSNVPLTAEDVKELESILWSEVGTRQDYEAEVGQKPLGEFVREIVGMDMNAAKEAFAQYLSDVNLDSRQIYFVNQIVEYIVYNGVMKDLSVLQEPPFTDRGSIVEIFTDLSLWAGIKSVIDRINANAAA